MDCTAVCSSLRVTLEIITAHVLHLALYKVGEFVVVDAERGKREGGGGGVGGKQDGFHAWPHHLEIDCFWSGQVKRIQISTRCNMLCPRHHRERKAADLRMEFMGALFSNFRCFNRYQSCIVVEGRKLFDVDGLRCDFLFIFRQQPGTMCSAGIDRIPQGQGEWCRCRGRLKEPVNAFQIAGCRRRRRMRGKRCLVRGCSRAATYTRSWPFGRFVNTREITALEAIIISRTRCQRRYLDVNIHLTEATRLISTAYKC